MAASKKSIKLKFDKIQKRDGQIVDFDIVKIGQAIHKALTATNQGNGPTARSLTNRVINLLNKRFRKGEIPKVEEIQDIVEEVLILEEYTETARAYILYREQRRRIREAQSALDETVDMVDKYIQELDWQIKENANMAYSLQGLHHYVTSAVSKKYWLSKIYTKEIREAVNNGDFHIHNLDFLGPYCCGWDLYDLLVRGFGGVTSKVESRPPKHLRTALGQLVNFFYTLQGEVAGANAVSNFDTLLAPFIRYDNLNYQQVKQATQEFVFNCAIPTRVGFQTPFLNVTLDIKPPANLAHQPVIIGGTAQKENYGDFQEEMNIFNRAFAEVMAEGDAKGRVFTFPIPTYNITKDFDWDNPALQGVWEMTAKYGVPYFTNFINSDMNADDARSMCCRLRLDNRELYKRGGGLFGSYPLTGSIGVVTLNLPRLGYLAKTKRDFFARLERMMELAKISLEIKRKTLDDFIEKGLYPYSRHYLEAIKKIRSSYWHNHFSTIGLVGMNEMLLNFLDKDISSVDGRKFAAEALEFMRDKLVKYQEETGNLYNLEATPAEGTSYRLAKIDKEKFPDIITAGEQEPYYTNSSQLPVGFTHDLFEALELQDNLQTKYTGGCIEKGNKVLTDKGLLPIEDIVKNFKNFQPKPIRALSYNLEKGRSEWDEIVQAVAIDVAKHNKIRIKGERNLDIVTSDWHPFFVSEKVKINPTCPVCQEKVGNIKGFATHLRWEPKCRSEYQTMPKYRVVEKRADELKVGDYILQNSNNLYSEKKSKLNEDLAWLVGFFIGDGCISKFRDDRGGNDLARYKVRFYSQSEQSLQRVSKIISRYFGAEAKVIQNDKRSKVLKELATSKKDVVEFFFSYGFAAGKKTYSIYISQKVKEHLTNRNVFSLLSGLMDSDGHISKRDGDFEYQTVSAALAEDILEICTQAGIAISKTIKKTRRSNEVDIYRLRISQYQMTMIKDQLNSVVNFSNIKKSLSNRKKRYLPVVRVKGVSKTKVSDTQFYDLMTKNNHNYLAGKNTLVFIHNTVLHAFLGERIQNPETIKSLLKKIFSKHKLPYLTFSPTFSICPNHGYLAGEHFKCPKCLIEQPCEVYSRVVGYIRPVQQWHPGKQEEFRERMVYKIKERATAKA